MEPFSIFGHQLCAVVMRWTSGPTRLDHIKNDEIHGRYGPVLAEMRLP